MIERGQAKPGTDLGRVGHWKEKSPVPRIVREGVGEPTYEQRKRRERKDTKSNPVSRQKN